EFRWGDANDRIISPADGNAPSDDLRIGAEPLLPELVSQHYDRMPPEGAVVFRRDHTTQRRAHSQQTEIVACYVGTQNPLIDSVRTQTNRPPTKRGQTGQRLVTVAIIRVLGVTNQRKNSPSGHAEVGRHDLFRLRDWQGSQQDAVHQTENRR